MDLQPSRKEQESRQKNESTICFLSWPQGLVDRFLLILLQLLLFGEANMRFHVEDQMGPRSIGALNIAVLVLGVVSLVAEPSWFRRKGALGKWALIVRFCFVLVSLSYFGLVALVV